MKKFQITGIARLLIFFIILCLGGGFLLQLPLAYKNNIPVPFVDSLFTSVSAVCVTGLSTLDMNIYTTEGFTIIAILIELGGLGIITFLSLLLTSKNKKVSFANRRAVKQFALEDVENNPKKIIRIILYYTLLIQSFGFLCLIPILKNAGIENFTFDAMFLAISAFCNAGFSPYSDSLIGFNNQVALNVVIMLLIISGGIGFIVIANLRQVRKGIKKGYSAHTKIVFITTTILIFAGAACFFILEYNHAFKDFTLSQKISAAFFQSVTPRTCGFETVAQPKFTYTSSLITLLFMFIGGSPASIAGGIKTTTFFVAFLYVIKGDETTGTVRFFNRTINNETINKAIMIIVKSVLCIFIAIILLTLTEQAKLTNNDISIYDLVFETVSAFGTVGLSNGITSTLTTGGKIILIVTMFIGRTALATMILILPSVAKSRRLIQLPKAEIIVG